MSSVKTQTTARSVVCEDTDNGHRQRPEVSSVKTQATATDNGGVLAARPKRKAPITAQAVHVFERNHLISIAPSGIARLTHAI